MHSATSINHSASTGPAATRSDAEAARRLDQAADEFEALFVGIMLKAARQGQIEGGLFDSHAMSTYREMLDEQLALTLARRHDFGIGPALTQQFGSLLGTGQGQGAAANEAPGLETGLRRSTHVVAAVGAPPAGTRSAFVERLRPHAIQAARRLGVSADALIAQAALETGWGKHVIRRADGSSAHNYFGVKAGQHWSGAVVDVPTTEFIAGRSVTMDQSFRAYPDIASAFEDYVTLLAGSERYRKALDAGKDTAAFAQGLVDGGYATDPDYATKIIRIAGDAGSLRAR